MCGIGGIQGNISRDCLPEMSRRMAHRGPDDEGLIYLPESRTGFVHRRLSIQDLSSAGHQPMFTAEGGDGIVYNGEIYNFLELRRELQAIGHSFRSGTDTEVLLKLYQVEGFEMLDRLEGIFAFAIWDSRRKSLFLARDGLGVKPLYTGSIPGGFAFASEMKALMAIPELARDLSPEAAAQHLTLLWTAAPTTVLKGVEHLEPGCAMTVERGKVTARWRFYDPPLTGFGAFDGSEEDAAEQLRHHLRSSVEKQLISDAPVGAFLSGGLDSSAICALGRKHADLTCFTIGFRGDGTAVEGFEEDLPYARHVADHLGVQLNTVWVGPDLIYRLPEMIWHLDEPNADPAALNVLAISELARSKGIKVLLSGTGGDDVFGGYRRHRALALEGLWGILPQSVRHAVSGVGSALPQRGPTTRRLAKLLRYVDQPRDRRMIGHFFWMDPSTTVGLLNPDFRAHIEESHLFGALDDSLARMGEDAGPLDRMLFLEMKHFLADHNLLYTDKLSMAASVEVRVPFLDRALVAFGASLPARMKLRGRHGKWALKKAMEGSLPRRVIYRSKSGFGAPLRRWLNHELAPMVEEILDPAAIRRRGIFQPQSVTRLLDADRRGAVDASYTIFALMCFELWCQTFIDAEGSGPLDIR